ncbi:MAG TPA: hypothetical protein VIJ33_06485 [Solirubrobacteraceae bacterium]
MPASWSTQRGPHTVAMHEMHAQRPSGYVQLSFSGHMSALPASGVAGHEAGLPLHEETGALRTQRPPPHSARVVQ